MKKPVAILVTIVFFLCFWGTYGFCAADSPQPDQVKLQADYGGLPLSFIKNQGQVDEDVLYYLKGREGTIYFTKHGIVYDLVKKQTGGVGAQPAAPENLEAPEHPSSTIQDQESGISNPKTSIQNQKFSRLSFTLKPQGANPDVQIIPQDELPGKINCFIGNDSAKWHTNISTYKSVIYQNLYPGIDLKVYGTNQQMEYDFIIHPGADPNQISLAGEGIDSLAVDSDGNLLIKTALTDIKHLKPVIYQEVDGKRVTVEGSFTTAQNRIGFEVKNYNKKYPLTIDPLTLSYSTYLGGSGDEYGYSIAIDSAGCAYVIGYTGSSNFPTANAYHSTPYGNFDVFVTKFTAAGNALVYSTYLGGSKADYGYGIAVDSAGCAYLTGSTSSTNFPTVNPYQATGRSVDAFVTKLNAGGNALVYSTYLGGSYNDCGNGIAVDSAGCAYVTGYANSTNFPTANPYQATIIGGCDAFVTKLTAAGNALVYSTYLGGSANDFGERIAIDSSGCAYVTGLTSSTNFPTVNPYQATCHGNNDVFVTKLTATGNALVYSTYLGGGGNDDGYGIAVDSAGCAYVTGPTCSSDFPTTANAYNRSYNRYVSTFVTKFTAAGNDLAYSTFLGGNDEDRGFCIAVDSAGCAYVTGWTHSRNFPMVNPYQGSNAGIYDAFVIKLAAAGNAMVYGTYLGGTGYDYGLGIAVDSAGSAYVSGYTNSSNFPTANPYQATNRGGLEAIVFKLTYCTPTVADFSANPTSGYAPLNVAFTDQSTSSPISWSWDFGDSGTSTLQNPSHQYTNPGTYTVELTETNACGNNFKIKTNYITVNVSPAPVADFSGNPTASGYTPLNVAFTDLSTNSPTSWSWDFGDSGTSTLQNPSHQYTNPGTYTVALTASNASGNNTKTKTAYITITSQGPVHYFYDDLGRLIKAQDDAGNIIEYTYDSVGNRQTKTITIP